MVCLLLSNLVSCISVSAAAVSANHTVTPLTPLISSALSLLAHHSTLQPLLSLPVVEESEEEEEEEVSDVLSFMPVPAHFRLTRLR